MKNYLYTALWGVIVWFFATIFFVLIGERVLYSPGTSGFTISIVFLLIGTGILLSGVTYVCLIFDKSENAALKFGLIGTIVGLTLDTFSISNHHVIFPKLDDSQVIAFTAWMTFAYALFLIIPTIINERKKRQSN
ncbi:MULTISPECIES: DUF5367 family protein [Bacillus]|uniref:DUF5367 domain-containing protein n=2 Tax=Bacillus TaxID=1386 RepID=A0A0M3RAL8_9BACI|nr:MULTISPECIES: DUF5367 family protein [Bacillus]ALC83412.1 hypothetical protein AM592_19075 [Bacillus gobiensis]MBP1082345.1 uncharacterized membrane protein HdeD (DUF308 family) [Bacillus capparidis]MED1097396.1 DUF5367 family protein [Bacillus capparidis]